MATIRKRGESWQVQIRRDGHPPISKTFRLRSDAAIWARETEGLIDRGQLSETDRTKSQITVGDALQRYAVEVSPTKRGERSELSRVRTIQAHSIASVQVAKLTTGIIADYRNERLRTIKADTIRRELGLLRHCLELGRREWGLPLVSNPIAQLSMPKPGRARNVRMTVAEYARLNASIERCRVWYMKPIVNLAIHTGMRRGELVSMEWRHIDYVYNTLHIPLTKNGVARTIPLTPDAVSILRSTPPRSDLVFPISGNAIRLGWERVRKRADLDHVRFHDLRHEAISRFFELGLSVPEVALISGHKDVRMLFRYTHLRPEDVASKLTRLMNRR